MFVSLRTAKCGLISFGRIPLTYSEMDIPVRTLECCSGDLADLKVNLQLMLKHGHQDRRNILRLVHVQIFGDAQARRLKIRVTGVNGKKYFAHTLNNTVVAPPRMLIAFLENNLNEDGIAIF